MWDQGIRVESLDGSLIYADHHSDRGFNPASVIKIATSLAALERFGPEHRFETSFYVDGAIDEKGVLDGDLILSSDGDPEMGTADLVQVIAESGVEVTRHEVLLPEGPLRQVGEYDIQIRLHTDVQTQIKVEVVGED